MRNFILIIFILLSNICLSQTKYRLFLNPQVRDSTNLFTNSLDRTNQIYEYSNRDSVIVFKNNDLKIKLYKNTLDIFFGSEYIGTYRTRYWDCYTHIIVEFQDSKTEYFFFKLYSKDGTY